MEQRLPNVDHFHRQDSGIGFIGPSQASLDPTCFRYDLLEPPRSEEPSGEDDGEQRIRLQVFRLEPLAVASPPGSLRLSELAQKVAETAALSMCVGRPESDILGRLDQLAGEASWPSSLSALFLIHRADSGQQAGGVVYKSRQCETVLVPGQQEDGGDGIGGDLCRQCRTFFRQLFGTDEDQVVEEGDSLLETVEPGGDYSTQDDSKLDQPEEPDRCEEISVVISAAAGVEKDLLLDGDWEVKTTTKRKRAAKVPAFSCPECCIEFRSQAAFKRHLRVWHFESADGGSCAIVGQKPATLTKSCPYCPELFPVGR